MDELMEMLTLVYGEHVPEELLTVAQEIAADGVITVDERARLLQAQHEYMMRNTSRRLIGPGVVEYG